MKQKIRKVFQIRKKKKIYDDLVEIVKTFDKKEKYNYHDHYDLDYHGIRDMK